MVGWIRFVRAGALLSIILLALRPSSATAETTVSVALVPVFVGGESPEHAWLGEALYRAASARLPLVDRARVEAALSRAPQPGCHDDPACIAWLARDLSANRVLVVAVVPYLPEIRLAARLHDATGALIGSSSSSFPRSDAADRVELAQRHVDALLDRLPIRELGQATPAGVAVKPGERGDRSALRVTSYALMAGSVAAAGVGAVVALSAGPDRERLASFVDAAGNLKPGAPVDEARELQDSLEVRERWVTGLLIGAGAAAIASVPLFLVSTPANEVKVSAAPLLATGGGGVMVSGSF
ncbi:MAG: hypothetical protein IRZ16_19270 [Myxococcaceae bacterium]|nr:hypothetical protein [Myxococcaceae bacterium]